ncbi:5'-nucleotidase C-terminal domain-containing protein [Neobacillus niacini]|uniref:5'-nucleotidase C-terminal domain-containing protein n=1 Tax=Neobacillus niacini TaxID=86668 RepID=UPI0021CB0B33|nr:5'-nucleotidase C-terminal domain-containing protein [Neobacillus niacini]MCM3763561.1 5'-nucleotidase C-terminal domain-containing protein [Neobacillus niacini]
MAKLPMTCTAILLWSTGFKYTFTFDDATKTGKVVKIFLLDGSKINPNKEYSVVVNNYMYGNAKYGIGALSTGLEIGPEDLQATVDFVKSLPKPFEYTVPLETSRTLALQFPGTSPAPNCHRHISVPIQKSAKRYTLRSLIVAPIEDVRLWRTFVHDWCLTPILIFPRYKPVIPGLECG